MAATHLVPTHEYTAFTSPLKSSPPIDLVELTHENGHKIIDK